MKKSLLLTGSVAALTLPLMAKNTETKPNIVWIMAEDWAPDLSCYGTKGISTPNIDKLAENGVKFTSGYCTAPVCSPSRSAMMTGMHQNYVGGNQHRTGGKKPLPYGIKPFTHLLENAGYQTVLLGHGKTDCNFTTDKPLFMAKDWKNRKEGQPFFAQVTFAGSHRIWKRDPQNPIDEKLIEVPPYYPDTPLVRRDIANGFEAMQIVDRQVGALVKRLEDEGIRDNTLIFFIGDNGRCLPRGKQFMYEPGIKVPIIMNWPNKVKKAVNDDFTSTLDITATILEVAGATPDYKLHGNSLFSDKNKEREYVYAARDKMDSTHDAMRTIVGKRYKLIHNLMPERPYCQYNWYKETSYPILAELNILNAQGKLTPEQAAFMAPTKPEFELFDLKNDPHEIKNLAKDPKFAEIKADLLTKLNAWRKEIKDQGVTEEFRKGGWAATYPTQSLKDWQTILELWKPWVFRGPSEKVQHPRGKITKIIRPNFEVKRKPKKKRNKKEK